MALCALQGGWSHTEIVLHFKTMSVLQLLQDTVREEKMIKNLPDLVFLFRGQNIILMKREVTLGIFPSHPTIGQSHGARIAIGSCYPKEKILFFSTYTQLNCSIYSSRYQLSSLLSLPYRTVVKDGYKMLYLYNMCNFLF